MDRKNSRLQYALLTVLLFWAFVAQTIISGYLIYGQRMTRDKGLLPFRVSGDSLEVQGPLGEMKAMGFQAGDELVKVDDEFITGYRQLERLRFALKPGQPLQITVRRAKPGQASQNVDLTVRAHSQKRHGLAWVFTIVLSTILPGLSLCLGFFVAFSRPRDKLAWLTLAMLASFGQFGSGNFFALNTPWLQIVLVYRSLLSNIWPLWVMLFGLYFPKPFPWLRGRSWIAYLLSVPFWTLLTVDFYTDIYGGSRIQRIHRLAELEKSWNSVVIVLSVLCIAVFFVSLAAKMKASKDPDARRRLQWLLWGSVIALTPASLVEIAIAIIGINLPLWLIAGALLAVVLFPLTLAYVIVVQRAMQVRVAMRMGVQHALARGGISVMRVLLAIVIVFMAVSLVVHFANPWVAGIIIAIAVALLTLLRKLGTRAAHWLDRRFFREAYNTEIILTQLSQNVASIRQMDTLLETVSRQISDSLHVPRVAVLLDSANSFRPAYAFGYKQAPAVELSESSATVRMLREGQQPSMVYFDDEDSWVQRTPDKERSMLRSLDSQLLLPLSLKERLLGIISLGPKLSEEPYSKADLRLLNAVASQTGLALENARLTESIKQEVIQRERINSELEIAREVQERLFPQKLPRVEGLEFAGYCRPQQGVGGDYYDFVPLANGGLGIAVGDVAGKGIAAALTMATLQAGLRGQTIKPSGGPAEMIQLINRLVYEGSASNRYATFFYGEYDPQSRKLLYVNAGHNSPIVYRPNGDGRQILRLEEGGTVIGLFPETPYEEASVQLQKGDVIVGFTDGISEAMDAKEEEWDEPRLIDCLGQCFSRNAADIIGQILDCVDGFTAGAAQHDDMTLVVVRVL
jgi:phosphoserine phosphatase RsbU/P